MAEPRLPGQLKKVYNSNAVKLQKRLWMKCFQNLYGGTVYILETFPGKYPSKQTQNFPNRIFSTLH